MRLARVFGVLCLSLSAFAANEIRITEGLKEEQVLQRNEDGVASATLKGTIAGKKTNGKTIEARVLGRAGVLPGLEWRPVGQAQKQAWSAELHGIPTGGPYRIEVRMEGGQTAAAIDNILVGDLWVLAGQSNMEGVGDLVDVQPPDPMVHSFDLSDHWQVAEEPLHTVVNAADRVHWRNDAQGEPEQLSGEYLRQYQAARKKGAGLGLPFAVEMVKRTGVPIGLLPCAHGGTSMEQWSPTLRDREGDSLYGSMYRRFQAVGGRVKGILWYQGESDANPKAAPEFHQRFLAFVKAVRGDFHEIGLPFYYVQIGRFVSVSNPKEWNVVQQAQLSAETEIGHSGMVASVDLTLDDAIHVSTPDLKRLGRRLADRVCHDLFPKLQDYGEMKIGPRPASVSYENGIVRVKFSNVNEGLYSLGRISGFSIHGPEDKPVPMIFKEKVDPAEASTVLLYIRGKLPPQAALHYGYGTDPYCNVRDGADIAVPAFGPMEIKTATVNTLSTP